MYPPLLMLFPDFARSCLTYRFDRLDAAKKNAEEHHFRGNHLASPQRRHCSCSLQSAVFSRSVCADRPGGVDSRVTAGGDW